MYSTEDALAEMLSVHISYLIQACFHNKPRMKQPRFNQTDFCYLPTILQLKQQQGTHWTQINIFKRWNVPYKLTDGNYTASCFIVCHLGILAPQLVFKYCVNNSHQFGITLTRTKKVSSVSIYLYKVNRIPMDYIGFSNILFWGQRNRMNYYQRECCSSDEIQSPLPLLMLISVTNE